MRKSRILRNQHVHEWTDIQYATGELIFSMCYECGQKRMPHPDRAVTPQPARQ